MSAIINYIILFAAFTAFLAVGIVMELRFRKSNGKHGTKEEDKETK